MMFSESDKVGLMRELELWVRGEAISDTDKGRIVYMLIEKINTMEEKYGK